MEAILKDINAIRTAEQSTLICSMKPARFKAFIRLLREVVKLHGPHPIRFENGRMAQPIGHGNFIVELDMGNLIGKNDGKQDPASSDPNGFSGNFIACDAHFRELSGVLGAGLVEVHDRGGVILFSNGHTEGVLYKSSQAAPHLPAPILKDATPLGEEVKDLEPKDLKAFVGKNRLVSLHCFGGQLEQIATRANRPYTFHTASQPGLLGRKPDMTFTAQHFLALAGKLELSLSLWRDARGTWLKTHSRSNMVNALSTYELLYEGRF